jgi:YfiH family protein
MSPEKIHPIESKVLNIEGIRHGFFTRQGGVSEGIYKSLNCGLSSKDNPEAVHENRRRVASHLTGKSELLSTTNQIHSATAVIIDRPLGSELPKADALVTRKPGIVLGALAADCAPVLLADPIAGVVASAHAGWRGAIEGIVDATVLAMEDLGASRRNIFAAIGPCIGQASYEVDLQFEGKFISQSKNNSRFFAPGAKSEKRQFNLTEYVLRRTQKLGLAAVHALDIDVYPDSERFFSYRRSKHLGEPDYARLVSAISLS